MEVPCCSSLHHFTLWIALFFSVEWLCLSTAGGWNHLNSIGKNWDAVRACVLLGSTYKGQSSTSICELMGFTQLSLCCVCNLSEAYELNDKKFEFMGFTQLSLSYESNIISNARLTTWHVLLEMFGIMEDN